MSTTLETERLLIRPPEVQLGDTRFIEDLLSDPDVGRFYPGMNPEKAIEVARWTMDHWKEKGFGPCIAVLKDTSKRIGIMGFKEITIDGEAMIDMGCTLAADSQGKGFAVEGLTALVNYGFSEEGYERVTAHHMTTHHAARALVEKLDFTLVRETVAESAACASVKVLLWELVAR